MIDIQFSDDPRVEELMPWSMCLRKHRMRKKFVHGYHRYLPRWVRMQYLGKLMTVPIRRALKAEQLVPSRAHNGALWTCQAIEDKEE